jgi:hypothetical protein
MKSTFWQKNKGRWKFLKQSAVLVCSGLFPIDHNPRHHPDFSGVNQWLTDAANTINARGGLYNPSGGILVDRVTKNEMKMMVLKRKCRIIYNFNLKVASNLDPR